MTVVIDCGTRHGKLLIVGGLIEANYKGHDITATALQLEDTQEWQPKLMITWTEGTRLRIKYPQITKYFERQVEAEREGLAFAKKWIDDGKPKL